MIYAITGLTILVAVGVSFLLYRRDFQWWELAILPAIFALAFLSGIYWFQQMGAPIDGKPTGTFQPIANVVDGDDIILWAFTERGHRLHRFPYSREEKKQLDKGKPLRSGAKVFAAPSESPYEGEQLTK